MRRYYENSNENYQQNYMRGINYGNNSNGNYQQNYINNNNYLNNNNFMRGINNNFMSRINYERNSNEALKTITEMHTFLWNHNKQINTYLQYLGKYANYFNNKKNTTVKSVFVREYS